MTDPVCRACGTPLRHTVVDLGSQPLSNGFLTRDALLAGGERRYPLHARVCHACFLVQVDDVVPREAIFDASYAYFSSYSDGWLAHCERFARAAVSRFALGPDSLVLEVASNDGYLLQYFRERGTDVLGVEPTANTAAVAQAKGIPTEVAFFTEESAIELAGRGVRADLVHGANVLAHVPDIRDFVAGFPHVMKPNGILSLEFPHLLRLIEEVQFDTIYHEHFSYLSFGFVEALLRRVGLQVFDVERLPTHGGSLRVYSGCSGAARPETDAVAAVRADEMAAGLARLYTYDTFARRCDGLRRDFLSLVGEARSRGARIAAYGAAAKGNTFLNYCGLGPDDISCVFDRSPHKQGRFLPGSYLPVLHPDRVRDERPDYVLILPWNLRDEIMGQLGFIREWGGRFVTAIPEVVVHP